MESHSDKVTFGNFEGMKFDEIGEKHSGYPVRTGSDDATSL